MQRKYVEYYSAKVFHKFFMNVSQQVGDSPFRATVLNFLYNQNPDEPEKVRIQSFITALFDFVEKIKDMPDPDPAPVLAELGLTETVQAFVDGHKAKLAAELEARCKAELERQAADKGLSDRLSETLEEWQAKVDKEKAEGTHTFIPANYKEGDEKIAVGYVMPPSTKIIVDK